MSLPDLSPWHSSFWKQLTPAVLPGYCPITETHQSMIRTVLSFHPQAACWEDVFKHPLSPWYGKQARYQ